QITINNAAIEIFVGDLVNVQSDAVAIPTNSRLLPSGTLRCRVLKEAGHKIQLECNQIISKRSNIPIGSAVITSGGNLNVNFIIHARAGHDQKKLMLATWNSLTLADREGINSIAFPPISIEVIGFNAKICAGIMIPTIQKYILEKNRNLKNVSICLETLPDYKDFESVLSNLTNPILS
ncbi:MAG: macro domain-containing protein, partial [Candidatus Lokiarchaeota archaeon]|nr:macro domain-containing protein [Candidatus Lokiarchaeota archaeon]